METDWRAVRSQFPACSRVTYLNAAGGSPMCAPAAVEGRRYFDEMLASGDACWDDWLARTEKVRAQVAAFLHAAPEEVVFTANTSMGLSLVAHLLQNKGGVLTLEDEFPSSTFPWINLGFQVDHVPSLNGAYSLDSISEALRPEHRILVVSHVQYKTGYRQDLAAIGRLCRSANLLMVVNATQSLGIFPVDVQECMADFVVFSGLKWACAGYGAGGLFIRKGLLPRSHLPLSGWRSVRSPEIMDNRRFELKEEASALEAGSPSFPAIFALGGALDMLQKIGSAACLERVLSLARLLENNLISRGFPVMYSYPEEHRSGILMVKTIHAGRLVQELARKKILVSARGEGLRISVNIFNNEEDIRIVTEALLSHRDLF